MLWTGQRIHTNPREFQENFLENTSDNFSTPLSIKRLWSTFLRTMSMAIAQLQHWPFLKQNDKHFCWHPCMLDGDCQNKAKAHEEKKQNKTKHTKSLRRKKRLKPQHSPTSNLDTVLKKNNKPADWTLQIIIKNEETTQRQRYVFMALLRVSRLRVSADPQVLNEQKTQNLG